MYFRRIDQVLAAEGHDRFRDVLIELAVDAEAADAAEAIAVFVEEFFLEERLGLFQSAADCRDAAGRKSASARLRGLSAVSSASVLRISGSVTLVTHSTRLEAAGLNLVHRLADLRAGLDQLFAALGIDDGADGVIGGLEAGRP